MYKASIFSKELANLVGITRQTLSRVMREYPEGRGIEDCRKAPDIHNR